MGVFASRCSVVTVRVKGCSVVGIRHVGLASITLGVTVSCDILPHFSRQCLSLPRKIYCGWGYHGIVIIIFTLLCCYNDIPRSNPQCASMRMIYPSGSLALTTRWLFRPCLMALLPKSSPGTVCESLINRSGRTVVSSNQIITSASGYLISVQSLPH